MSQLLVKCFCGIQLSTTADQAGSVMRCPKCNQQFRVPGGSTRQADVPESDMDFSSLPAPAAPASSAPGHRPRNPPVGVNSTVPHYRTSPRGAAQGFSLTSDRALRNTIIGSIVAITMIFVIAAGWMVYDRLPPVLAERALLAAEQDAASAAAAISPAGTTSTPIAADEKIASEGTNVPGRSPRYETMSDDAVAMSPVKAGDPSPATHNAFTPTLGSSATLSMPELIELVEPSIVRVVVKTDEGDSHGSGFVIDASGLIVTNYHVVEGATSVTIESRSGQTTIPLGFMIAEPQRDLCVLKVDASRFPCTPLAFATESPSKGESVAAFGSPLGFSFSATNGIVSANRSGSELQRSLNDGHIDSYSILGYTPDMDWVQTTAAISGGNSGGPLMNMRGEMVGVNTFTSTGGQNLNFAVSHKTVSDVVSRCGTTSKAFSELPPPTHGSASGGVLAQIFGVETITKTTGTFQKSSAGDGELRVFRSHDDAIIDIAVSDDGRYFAIAGLDQKTTVFDQKTGNAMYEIKLTEMPIRNVQFVANSKYLTTFRSAGTEPSVVYRDPQTGESEGIGVVFPILKLASVMTVSKDGRSIFACWINGTTLVRRYDHFLKSSFNVALVMNDRLTAGAFSDDGKTLMTASATGNLSLHKLDGQIMRTASKRSDAHDGKVTCVAAMPDGVKFVSAGEDGAVCLWKTFPNNARWRYAKFVGDDSDVLCLAVAPNGERIAVGRANGKLELFDVDSSRLIHTYAQHQSAVTSVAFFPNNKYFLTGTTSGIVRIMQSR